MNKVSKILILSLISNALLSIIKILAGIFGMSQALIADGIHSFSDLATDVVAIFGSKMALRPADKEHPFGHGKIEYVTSMIISFVIILLGFTMIKNSLFSSNSIPDINVIYFILFTLFEKWIVASFLYKKGKEYNNQILLSSGRESFTDVISNGLVIMIVILAQFSNICPFFLWVDKIGGIIIGIIIFITGLSVLLENANTIIGKVEEDQKIIDGIFEFIRSLSLPILVEKIHLLKYGPYYEGIVEVVANSNMKLISSYLLKQKIEKELSENQENLRYVRVNVIPERSDIYARKARSYNRSKKSIKQNPKS